MLQYFDTLTDDSGNSLLGATLQVLNYPSGSNANIYLTNGTAQPIANSTVTADITGQVSFFIPDGAYTLVYSYQGTPYKTRTPVQMLDPMGFVAGTDSGGAPNQYIVTSQIFPASLYVGLKLEFIAAHTNTGASTLILNAGAPQPIHQPGGSALIAGMIQANGITRMEWDGTQWQLVGSQFQPFYAQTPAEAAAGVTPTNLGIQPYYVARYGAVGDGVTDDAGAFNTAGSIGLTIFVPEPATAYLLNSNVTGLFEALGVPRFTGAGKIGLVSEAGVTNDANNEGATGGFQNASSMVIIGDSITGGTGASAYTSSYAWIVGRSVMNAANEGLYIDTGFARHNVLNTGGAGTPGVTTTGASVGRGIWGNRLNLSGAQTLTLTLLEVISLDIVYDASNSSGSFTIALNGTVVSTVAVSGSGFKSTVFPTYLKPTYHLNTRLADVVTVAIVSGSLDLCAVIAVKNSPKNPCVLHIGGAAGFAYQDYTSAANITELAFYLNATAVFGGNQNKTLVCNLATNNIYNVSKALSPAATVAQIALLFSEISAVCNNLNFVISIPPKANEAIFPVILSQYKYEDYKRAILSYARANNFTLIRHDLSALSTGSYYADGLHPNDMGHRMFAAATLDALRIKYDTCWKTVEMGQEQYLCNIRLDAVITMNSTWGPFGGLAGFAARAHLVDGNILLSGVIIPNGSGSATIGTLPAGFIPDTQDRYVMARQNVSTGAASSSVTLLISHTTGQIIIQAAVPGTDLSLDGISFPMWKFIES